MGLHDVKPADPEELRRFMKLLLRDVRALEKMLDEGTMETGVRRIGAEQEVFLVDAAFQAAPLAMEVLDRLKGDEHFTTELGLFNIECNLDPHTFGGRCLSDLEKQLNFLVNKARGAAQEVGAQIVLTGILPTLKVADLTLKNMTPNPRYFALNDALNRMRGGEYSFHIKGADEFIGHHDNVMLEACNTSFQVHFQADPDEFAKLYNIAQAVAAPALAVACNSPLLFGKRLWRETRIALFQQSVDTRTAGTQLRERHPRVSFGHRWLDDSVLEIFHDDIARFRVLINTEIEEDPFEALAEGRAPSLKALRTHNGTIYRWNRACYGISDGKPHLRIENRIMPSGPTTVDEVANAAFWFGLMTSVSNEHPDIRQNMDFDDAKSNFLAVARQGLAAQIKWTDGVVAPAGELIRHRLLPAARLGLIERGVDSADVDRYLDIIEERVTTGRTGAMWMIDSFQGMTGKRSIPERLSALTAATITRQQTGDPVHTWPLVEPGEGASWRDNFGRVEQFMTTDLVTVVESEPIELVVSVMDWHQVRHIPVEDTDENLVGLLTYLTVVRFMNRNEGSMDAPVSDIMVRELVTVSPETPTIEAVRMMRERKVSCLPVVRAGKIVGLITERDFLRISEELMEEKLA